MTTPSPSPSPTTIHSPPVLSPRSAAFVARLDVHADFASDGAANARYRGRWRAFFRDRVGPAYDGRVIFDVGCADAGHLARVAARHPNAGFVGLDWKHGSIVSAAERVAAAGLRNVALVRGRAQDLRASFDDGELDEVWVFQPEPCDRAAERPNRLMTETFLRDVAATLRASAGTLHLKTDARPYFDWVVGQLDASASLCAAFDRVAASLDFWNDAVVRGHVAHRPFADEVTFYESRFIRRKRPIHYLELRRR